MADVHALSGNPLVIGGASAIGGAAVGYALGRRRKKNKHGRKHQRRGSRRSRRIRKSYTRRRRTPHTAGKRRDTSHRRIRYTRNGQPYVILGNGRARFISMKSAKASHKQKGGRY